MLKISASIYESSGLNFFKTTAGIQSGLDGFNESSLVMTFWTNLGFTGIIHSFRLTLEGKAGKEISEPSRLKFLEQFWASNSALPNAEDNVNLMIIV